MKIAGVLLLSVAAAGSLPVHVVSQAVTRAKQVAVTFDAGADRGYAALILSTLERDHVHATFGMTGKWAVANQDLVRKMAHDGDVLMNHTYDHRSFTGLSTHAAPLTTAQRTWEIVRTDDLLRSMTGRTTRPYFRPPFGDYDMATQQLLAHLGYRYMVMWTVDSLGWNHLPAGAIVQRCLASTAPGSIFLMHVGIQSQDALALPQLIADVKRRGYTFVTVPALLSRH